MGMLVAELKRLLEGLPDDAVVWAGSRVLPPRDPNWEEVLVRHLDGGRVRHTSRAWLLLYMEEDPWTLVMVDRSGDSERG